MIMQHFGAPTRLLDWTASPYVAVYFAVRDLSQSATNHSGAVWYFNISCVRQGAQHLWGHDFLQLGHLENELGRKDALARKGTETIQLPKAMERMSSQLGMFTVAGNPKADHWPWIEQAQAVSVLPKDCGRIVINGDFKAQFLRQLYSANVQAAALFPGLEGIGQLIQDHCICPHGHKSLAGIPETAPLRSVLIWVVRQFDFLGRRRTLGAGGSATIGSCP